MNVFEFLWMKDYRSWRARCDATPSRLLRLWGRGRGTKI